MAYSSYQTRIWNSLPDDIKSAVLTYARGAELVPRLVIEFMIARFLELDVTLLKSRQTLADDNTFLADLPLQLQTKVRQYAVDTEIPPEFVIELAIAHFLDPDSVTFDDCQISVRRDLVDWLEQCSQKQAVTTA
ncbi:MAG: hypothetical protein AAGC54_01565 [Cyanobacteria bacterium P01_F01_bin.4]